MSRGIAGAAEGGTEGTSGASCCIRARSLYDVQPSSSPLLHSRSIYSPNSNNSHHCDEHAAPTQPSLSTRDAHPGAYPYAPDRVH